MYIGPNLNAATEEQLRGSEQQHACNTEEQLQSNDPEYSFLLPGLAVRRQGCATDEWTSAFPKRRPCTARRFAGHLHCIC